MSQRIFTVFPVFWIPKVPVQTLTTYIIQRIFARIRNLRPPFLYSGICTVHCGSRKTPNVTIDIVSALSSLDRYRWPCHSQKNNTSMLLVPQVILLLCTRYRDALKKNRQLITSDQRAYQKELQRNYTQLTEQLETLLRNKFGTLRGSSRQKYVYIPR